MATAPVAGRALRDQVVDRLRFDVLCGRLREGETIRQEVICTHYGVSRTPVREAIMQLRNEGLFESLGNRGVRVAGQVQASTRQFLDGIRHLVEEHALQLCFDKLNDEDFAHLDGIVDKMRKACELRDDASLAEHDMAFHRYLVERSGQSKLVAIWSLILGGLHAYFRTAYAAFENRMDIHREHAEIVDWFRAGNKQEAIQFYVSRIGTLPSQGPQPSTAVGPRDGTPPKPTSKPDVEFADAHMLVRLFMP